MNSTSIQIQWKRGHEDGEKGCGPRRPFPNAESALTGGEPDPQPAQVDANEAYMDGHRAGTAARYEAVENEGSEP